MEGWNNYRLSDYLVFNPKVKLSEETEYPFIEMADLGPDNKFAYPKRKRRPVGLTKFEEGDTLFAKITPCLENGNICQAKALENGVGVGSTEFFVFRGREGVSDNDFIYYLLKSYSVKEYAIRNMTGSGGQQRVPSDIFKTLRLSLPPMAESKRIGRFLSLLDEKISLLRRQNEILEKMAQAIFMHWFEDFEFPVSAEYASSIGRPELVGKPYRSIGGRMVEADWENGEIPEGWSVRSLGDIAANKKQNITKDAITGSENYIGLEHMPKGSISLSVWEGSSKVESNKTRFEKGEILFGKLRPYFHKVGVAPVSGICSTDILVINGKNDAFFGLTLMIVSNEKFIRFVTQASEGTRMPRTNWSYMSTFRIVLPPEKILYDFNLMINSFTNKIIANIFQMKTVAEIRDTLLPKLMSGELRLREY